MVYKDQCESGDC